MLISFRVKNFLSVVDTTIELTYAEGKAPNGYKEMETIPFFDTGTKAGRVVPCLGIYGANAGGKTNLIRAVARLGLFLFEGLTKSVFCNRLHPELKTTRFEVCFTINKSVFNYILEYGVTGVVEEFLSKDNKILFSINVQKEANVDNLASVFYTADKLKEIIKVECSDALGNQTRSFLEKIGEKYPGLNSDIADSLCFFKKIIDVYPSNEFPTGMGIDLLADALNTPENPNAAFYKIKELIKKMDFGIKDMTFNREKAERDESGKIKMDRSKGRPSCTKVKDENDVDFFEYLHSVHEDVNGNEVQFNFIDESEGTKAAFGIIGVMLSALEKGKVLFIDELDRSLHPIVFKEIVQLFKDKRYNKNNAQLIFTAHNTELLDADFIRVSEIGFVDKTIKNGTKLTRLAEFDGIRNVSDFRKRYLLGEFRGIPFPYI